MYLQETSRLKPRLCSKRSGTVQTQTKVPKTGENCLKTAETAVGLRHNERAFRSQVLGSQSEVNEEAVNSLLIALICQGQRVNFSLNLMMGA